MGKYQILNFKQNSKMGLYDIAQFKTVWDNVLVLILILFVVLEILTITQWKLIHHNYIYLICSLHTQKLFHQRGCGSH